MGMLIKAVRDIGLEVTVRALSLMMIDVLGHDFALIRCTGRKGYFVVP
jgi:hypothetical protein